jgi:alkylhydroperoxidase/carboxymuconolactone decarboxylase family protein YurZ
MRRFTDRGGLDWSAFEATRPGGLPDRRLQSASVTVAFQCDDGTEVAMDLPLGALEGLTDEELILLLTKGLK